MGTSMVRWKNQLVKLEAPKAPQNISKAYSDTVLQQPSSRILEIVEPAKYEDMCTIPRAVCTKALFHMFHGVVIGRLMQMHNSTR